MLLGFFFFFNDSSFGPYSCLSFNTKQKLLFRSNCCFGTNGSRHQFFSMDFTATHFSQWSSRFRLLLAFRCGGAIPTFNATSATFLVHAQLWDKARELPFRHSYLVCSCRL